MGSPYPIFCLCSATRNTVEDHAVALDVQMQNRTAVHMRKDLNPKP